MANSSKNPFAEAVLAHLKFPAGAFVVDLACGPGRPSLEIAARHPDLSVLGVDIAPEVIAQARKLASESAIGNVRFEVMNLEELAIASSSADIAVSLFGVMQVGDFVKSIDEMVRILKADAEFSLAAYDDMRQHTLLAVAIPVLSQYTAAELTPSYITAEPDAQKQGLLRAGMSAVHSEIFHCTVPFPSFDAVWQMLSSPQMFARVTQALDDETTLAAKAELLGTLAPFKHPSAQGYAFPFSCRIVWGQR